MCQECFYNNGGSIWVPECELIDRRGAYALVVHERHVALTAIGATQKFWMPGGGIEEGETPIQTVRRECREELGIDPSDLVVHESAPVQYVSYFADREGRFFRNVGLIYRCSTSGSDQRELSNKGDPDMAEHENLPKWVEIQSLTSAQFHGNGLGEVVIPILRRILGEHFRR